MSATARIWPAVITSRGAGQREDFLVKTMREYKGNIRPGYNASMGDVMQPISDTDILGLAYFTARQP